MITDSIVSVIFGDCKVEGSRKSLLMLFKDKLPNSSSFEMDVPKDTLEGLHSLLDFHLNHHSPQFPIKDPASCIRAVHFLGLDETSPLCDFFFEFLSFSKLSDEQREEMSSLVESPFWKKEFLLLSEKNIKGEKKEEKGLGYDQRARLTAFRRLPQSVQLAWGLHYNPTDQQVYHVGDDKGIILSISKESLKNPDESEGNDVTFFGKVKSFFKIW